jgi:glutamate carboxypeptidase
VPLVRERLEREPRVIDLPGGLPALILEATAAPSVLLLCHLDTVWPRGTLAEIPFAVTDGRATGPGVFDMKSGLVIGLEAAALTAAREHVTLLVTCDEEVGSEASRSLLEEVAGRSAAVLVLEAGGPGGALKIARKGVSMYDIAIEGRAAHAGLEPELGVNATVELAHLVLDLEGLADAALGTGVTPSVAASGTTTNTVPAAARLSVDVRAWTAVELLRVDAAIRARTPANPQARIVVSGGPNRFPLEPTHSADLFRLAEEAAREHGLPPVASCSVGGASDGNFTAAMGIPTLDGLGAVGSGAHARSEWVDVASLPARAELVARLVERIVSRVDRQR